MNYHKHYNLLIERCRSRSSIGYTESHHIIPRCMGGYVVKDNLVDLTPEEHFVAHQLLVKMYPGVPGLASAARMMTISSNGSRSNKLYGWLRRKFSEESKLRQSSLNSNRRWISNIALRQCRKILKTDPLPQDWVEGRNSWNKFRTCKSCGTDLLYGSQKIKCQQCMYKERFLTYDLRAKTARDRMTGTKFYTNGTEDRRIRSNESIPSGFVEGRTNGKQFLKNSAVLAHVGRAPIS